MRYNDDIINTRWPRVLKALAGSEGLDKSDLEALLRDAEVNADSVRQITRDVKLSIEESNRQTEERLSVSEIVELLTARSSKAAGEDLP